MPTRFRVRISETAETDIDDVWNFIAEDSLKAATAFIRHLEERIATLETLPTRCPPISESDLIGTQYRHLIYGDYRMIFRIVGQTVYVLRVIHSARLLDASQLKLE